MIVYLTADLASIRITFEPQYPMRLIADGESELEITNYHDEQMLREAGLLRQFKKIETQASSWLILSGLPTPDIGNHVMDATSRAELDKAISGKTYSLLRLHCPDDSDLNFVYLWLAQENFQTLLEASLSAMAPHLRLSVSFVPADTDLIAALASGQTVYSSGVTVQVKNKNLE